MNGGVILNKDSRLIVYLLLGVVLLGAIFVGGVSGNLSEILVDPPQSSDSWFDTHPYLLIGDTVISEPSSSLIVLALTVITLWTALMFLRKGRESSHLFWFGISFLFTGLGAGLAGVSYQAFGYEIKCRGFEYCIWTSWWEVTYMISTVAGVGAAFVGIAYYIFSGKAQRFWSYYAVASTLIYVIIAVFGTYSANRLLISFEFMVTFIGAGLAAISLQSLLHYFKEKNSKAAKVLWIGAGIGAVITIYFAALVSDFAAALWERGIWFNENDVLHVLMIFWVLLVYRILSEKNHIV